MVCHEQHESHRVEHAGKMAQAESKTKYSRRRHAVTTLKIRNPIKALACAGVRGNSAAF